MMWFTRIFHTVGQGAFYSEKIRRDKDRVFRMVYDCGSISLPELDLIKRIKSDFDDDMNVDILFISHFDKDHTNGIKTLNPRTIVIPFLSKDQIFLLKLYNKIWGETYDVILAENPNEIFKKARIIRILPDNFDLEEDVNNGIEIRLEEDLTIEQDNKLQSKSPITLSYSSQPFWEYIPYNPNWDEYAESFKTEIKKAGLDWDQLKDLKNGDYFKENISTLKTIYNHLKPKNLHSLVVYSNTLQDSSLLSCCFKRYCYCCISRLDLPCGCIYFGDATVSTHWCDSFYKYLSDIHRLHRIGTLQVPHHGSYLSLGQNIISTQYPFKHLVCCIISVGEFNHFGHPSSQVMQELQRKGGIVFMVTEASSSVLIQAALI